MVKSAVFLAVLLGVVGWAAPGRALPLFAHQYELTCQKCHSVVPRLTAFGEAFRANGYRLPAIDRERVAPLSTKINLQYTSAPDPGLPKAVIDEIELLTAGTLGARANYFVEQYLVDGGRSGNLREAWLRTGLTRDEAPVPISLTAGQFTLPLPVDPETFRETATHYGLFDQTVGINTFSLFAPRLGILAEIGRRGSGLSGALAALRGHDPQSGSPTAGTDVLGVARVQIGAIEIGAYRYIGKRPVGGADDRFSRTGLSLITGSGRVTTETVLQNGFDTNADGGGIGRRSSGGFSQVRYAFSPRYFALARYDGTQGSDGFLRTATFLLGARVQRNTRLTLEDTVAHSPRTLHTLIAQYTIGW